MENPSYYSIIIAEVRYDERLSSLQKLLYSEITALTNKTGECWASNSYFAKLYKVSDTWVSLSIKKLVEYGYLESRIAVNEGNVRYLSLTVLKDPIKLELKTSLTTVKDPYLTTVKVNNIKSNNKKNNKESKEALPKMFSKREDITEQVFQELSEKHNVSLEFVADSWDTACNWLDANGKKQKNYKAFFINWIKREKQNLLNKTSKKQFNRKGGYAEITDY